MSKLQELIKKLCSDGVEFRKLGEVCEFINGFAFKSSLFKDEGLPIIRITNINGVSIDLSDVKFFDSRDYKSNLQSFSVSFGDILIAMSGATTGKIGYYDNEDIAYLNQRVGKFVPNVNVLNNRYLFHFLLSKTSELYIMAGGGAQPNLSSNKLMNELYIPLPPLEIQNEIVRILDTFTSHTAELQAELQARKEQYEYYRNKLLTFDENDEGVKWMKLGDLFDFKNGLNKGKEFFGKGSPIVNFTDVYNKRALYKETLKGKVEVDLKETLRYNVHKGDVFFTRTSETPNDIGMSSVMMDEVENCVFSGFVLRGRPRTQLLLPKYCAYCFSTNQVRKEIVRNSSYTTRALTSGTNLSKISIPVPPLSEQQRIVSILDKFESLVNDLTAGLPAEIAAVQEQYEYYRNKLLAFERKS